MIALTDSQLEIVTDAVHMVPVEKRDLYLQRIAAMLRFVAEVISLTPMLLT